MFDDRVLLMCIDEPGANPARWDICRKARAAAAQAWPDLPILPSATIQQAASAGMDAHLDMLAPVVNRMHDKVAGDPCCVGNQRNTYDAFLQLAGNRLWMCTSDMSYSSNEPGDDVLVGTAGNPVQVACEIIR